MKTQRARRIKIGAAIVLICLIGGLLITFYTILNLSLPELDGVESFDQLDNRVEITTDSMGLPQIWAESEHDGYFAFGYKHASDRLFQMELIRHVAYGRLSEMLGERTLEEDMRQRRAGHAVMAEAATANLDDQDRARLQAYVDGINAYYDECAALPLEFYLLQLEYERWTIKDCLAILSFQTWFSDALLNKDILFLTITEKVGAEKAATILTGYPDWAPVTVNNSTPQFGTTATEQVQRPSSPSDPDIVDATTSVANNLSTSIRDQIASVLIDQVNTPFLGSYSSNAWAIGPSRSLSGKALFASDPHLDVTRLPGFWYFIGLHIKESGTNIVGITTPGLPMVAMGYTGRSAYAFTAAGIDQSDIFRETINPDDSDSYLFRNDTLRFEHRVESLHIAGSETPQILDIRSTHNGPIWYENDSTGAIYSLNWAGFDSDLALAISAGFDLHRACTVEDFRSSVTMLGALNANWVYADVNGHIAYQLGSPTPMQKIKDSRLPRDARRDQNDWRGYYPMNLSPHSIDPKRGWLGNCNNRPDWGSYLYQYDGHFFVDRIIRLEQLMSEKEKYDIEDMKTFQRDRTDLYLLRWRDFAVKLIVKLGESGPAQRLIAWDGTGSIESRETLLMQLFLNKFKELTFRDELGDLHKQMRIIWLDRIFHEGDSSWFDDISTEEVIEDAETIAIKAMKEALASAENESWGDRNHLTVQHPLAAVPLLGSLLDLSFGPYRQPGTAGTLNASFFKVTDDYQFETFVAPSWRMLVDFSDSNFAQVVLPAGNSGNPASDYFSNFIEQWREGSYWTISSEYSEVKKRATNALILEP